MKMTLKHALDMHTALNVISRAVLPGQIAKKLYDARVELERHVKFYNDEESKYIKTYNGECDENGRIQFDTSEHGLEYIKKINELQSVEVEADIHHIGTINANAVALSVDNIIALKDIVTIE